MRPAALLVAVATALVACSRGAHDEAPIAALQATSNDEVVATVDGRPINAADVARQARARGVDAPKALSDLVDAEVLAGEAARRGLEDDLEVRDETKGALVRRYLELGFEREVTPNDVPELAVRREYQRNLAYLNHNVYTDVWHILVPVAKDATPEQKEAARQRAAALARRARGMTVAEFKQLGHDEGLRTEEIVTARDGWVERPFSEAAFTQLKNPGDVSTRDVETTYGFHVLYLVRWIPAEHVTLSEAAPKLRESLFGAFEKRAFAKLVDEAMARYKIELHPEHLPQ
jgi:parvulin-like peptidyl-prolyl isomerase